jgi:hypothetical protein
MTDDRLPAELTAIREREQAATPGPWAWRGNVDNGDPYLTSRGYREVAKPDGTTVRHHAGDVLGHIPVELTRDDALRCGVGHPDSLPEPKIPDEPAETYDKRWDAAIQAAQAAAVEDYLTDEYGNSRTEQRMAFCTDWLYTDARKLAVFEVAPGVTDRADPRVYRADITGIRHPDAEFIAAARSDVPRLLAAVDAALGHHRPVQLYSTVEDYRGNHRCPHDEGYDGDAHYEGDDGLWYCTSLPTVRVCASCCDEGDPDLRAAWECPTYRDLLAALTGKGKADD